MQLRTKSRAGFGLLEAMISVALLAILLGSGFLALGTTSSAYRSGKVSAELSSIAHRALQDVAEGLRASSPGTVTMTPSSIDFLEPLGIQNEVVAWGPPRRIRFDPSPTDPDDGRDNDQNGLVDEGRVSLVVDPGLVTERSRVIGHFVRGSPVGELDGNGVDDDGNGLVDEEGLWFRQDGNVITIGLTLERLDGNGNSITKTAQRSVALRNP